MTKELAEAVVNVLLLIGVMWVVGLMILSANGFIDRDSRPKGRNRK